MKNRKSLFQAWKVYLGDEHFDTVYFAKDCDYEYVMESLIEHDYYPAQDLRVEKETA